jgi:hypothetical protein
VDKWSAVLLANGHPADLQFVDPKLSNVRSTDPQSSDCEPSEGQQAYRHEAQGARTDGRHLERTARGEN